MLLTPSVVPRYFSRQRKTWYSRNVYTCSIVPRVEQPTGAPSSSVSSLFQVLSRSIFSFDYNFNKFSTFDSYNKQFTIHPHFRRTGRTSALPDRDHDLQCAFENLEIEHLRGRNRLRQSFEATDQQHAVPGSVRNKTVFVNVLKQSRRVDNVYRFLRVHYRGMWVQRRGDPDRLQKALKREAVRIAVLLPVYATNVMRDRHAPEAVRSTRDYCSLLGKQGASVASAYAGAFRIVNRLWSCSPEPVRDDNDIRTRQ
uniref:Uncharacterized protein n=1 Tax=Anopheles minimus TaxID=112268 RepID=A0A182W7X6_9DIPT